MSASSSNRPVCLSFQTAIQVHRILSINRITGNQNRSPLPAIPPQRSDLEPIFDHLENLGVSRHLLQPLHTLTSSPMRCRSSSRCYPHVCTFPLPPSTFLALSKGILCAKPALAFIQAGTYLSFPALLELGYELCGTYRIDPRSHEAVFQMEPLVSCAEIRMFIRKHPHLNGAKKAAQALAFLADGSASPRETKAAILLALPKHRGGYGFGTPVMNHEVRATAKARSIAGRNSFRCDLCWPDVRLDVEYQSREFHEGEASRIRDSRRTNALMSMGFNVIAITNEELESLRATDVIASTIAKAIGKRMRKEPTDHMIRKVKLRKELGLPA